MIKHLASLIVNIINIGVVLYGVMSFIDENYAKSAALFTLVILNIISLEL